MDGKVLIVGGRSGIGLATSILLAEKYPGLAQDVPQQQQLDVTYHQGMARYVREHGPYSHIVYSAGINHLAYVEHPKIGMLIEDMMDVNAIGFVSLVSACLRSWPAAPVSAVAVSSDAARIPMRGSVAYCASKAALSMAVRVMARELAPLHRINAVAPGMVEDTPMTDYIDRNLPEFRGWALEYVAEYEKQNTPSGRRATKSEIAETIAWVLFGPEQMTGAILDVNGGR